METYAWNNLFYNVHDFWRNSYSADISVAEALTVSVPKEFYMDIDCEYSYPSYISAGFANEHDEWLSKLTLDFYIETLSPELANLTEYADQVHSLMLYSEINC
jgi:hypothetical protein